MTEIEVLYAQKIRGLPAQARLQLLVLIAQDLAAPAVDNQGHSTEPQGRGKGIRQGTNAQEYASQWRREWDEPT